MIEKRKKNLYKKFVILVLCLLILIRIFVLTLSSYESKAESDANIDLAFYVLNEDYQSMNINLDNIFPSDDSYIYTFTISNEKDGNRADTNLEYDLKIRTTTNLPLEYKLYKNQDYNDIDAQSIIINDNIEKDASGTYFRTMETPIEKFYYDTKGENIYYLVVDFPSQYNSEDYQNIVEGIEISVKSHQITG